MPISALAELGVFLKPGTYLSKFNIIYATTGALVYAAQFPLASIWDEEPAAIETLTASWALSVICRNAVLVLCVYSAWHHLLYVEKSSNKKIQSQEPSAAQHSRDRFWTMCGSVMASIYELGLTYFYCSRLISFCPMRTHPVWNLITFIIAGGWADFHFYFAHRMMHPFFSASHKGFDPGRLLYKHAHYLHHKSHNPGPWSGMAMHPIEHLLYFSRALLPLLIPIHPVVFLFINTRAMLGPAPGHHGYEDYGGSRFHNMHHATSSCNYGTRGPLDRIFGTFKGDKEDRVCSN